MRYKKIICMWGVWVIFTVLSSHLAGDVWGQTPLTINYTSLSMSGGASQDLSASGGYPPYTWSQYGGGTITPGGGDNTSANFNAPSTNPNCSNNAMITLTDSHKNTAEIKLAVNSYLPAIEALKYCGLIKIGNCTCDDCYEYSCFNTYFLADYDYTSWDCNGVIKGTCSKNGNYVKPGGYYEGVDCIEYPNCIESHMPEVCGNDICSNPNGPVNGNLGVSYTYSTGDAASDYGHSIEYLFDWGDGTNSGWLSVGQTSASHSWSSQGNYPVKAQARCSIDPSVVSSWSGATSVSIVSPPGNDSYTKSLLHMNGADGSTTFTDNAAGGTHTWTRYGTAQIDTAQSKFGGASLLLDGTGDYLSSPDSTDWDFESGDFTIDFWVRFGTLTTTNSTGHGFFSKRIDNTNYYDFRVWCSTGPVYNLQFVSYENNVLKTYIGPSWSPSSGVWYHLTVVRSGNSWYLFVDGTQLGTTVTDSDAIPTLSGGSAYIGQGAWSQFHNGWIDELRVSKGIARWTSNFTPPTVAYAGEYTLAVNVVGSGTVTKNPDQPIYIEGTSVTLTAVNGSQTFSEWSGGLTGNTNPSTIVMDGNKSVTATFGMQGWTYRKAVTLSRASGAVTNYQMRLLVGETSGASGEDVDCNGHVRADFNDLRFTTSDGATLLDYWIESISGSSPNQLATVWIEFDSIGTSDTTFYMYYGKSGAAAYSNGDNTFLFFDDFPGDALNTDKWTVAQGDVSVSSGYLVLSGTSGTRGIIRQKTTAIPRGFAATSKGYGNGTVQKGCNFLAMILPDGTVTDCAVLYGSFSGTANQIVFQNDDEGVYTDGYLSISTFDASHQYKITSVSGSVKYYQDPSQLRESTINIPDEDLVARFAEGNTNGQNFYVDWIHIRKFGTTEPAWGSWGAEQAN